ncbi:pectinesterase inhibitor 5 [Ziziphus jujuba]|uniref:Pectinesterase inhibitor 5 n=1 Tax=Ziziphus jujuba TaxID=326968 RepID=A0ABM3I4S8_ZIZJJ|nr:pectinesterase inhibitor 5 [Ziziphus jujuba]
MQCLNMAGHQFAVQSCALIILYMSLLELHATVADTQLVDSICKQAESYEFCSSTLNGDLRSERADLHGLAIISIAETIAQIRVVFDERIPEIIRHQVSISNPIDKQRIKDCQSDYNGALHNFLGAYRSSSGRSYWEVIDWVRDGANEAIHCEDIYRWHDPLTVCPISAENHNVIKLAEIVLIVVQSLLTIV